MISAIARNTFAPAHARNNLTTDNCGRSLREPAMHSNSPSPPQWRTCRRGQSCSPRSVAHYWEQEFRSSMTSRNSRVVYSRKDGPSAEWDSSLSDPRGSAILPKPATASLCAARQLWWWSTETQNQKPSCPSPAIVPRPVQSHGREPRHRPAMLFPRSTPRTVGSPDGRPTKHQLYPKLV